MNRTVQTVASGIFPYRGERVSCDVIKFGNRLRIVARSNDRSINNKGYMDLNAIRKDFPGAV